MPEKMMPRTLYVYIEYDNGDPYVVACENIEDAATRNDPDRKIGLYELRETGTVEFELKTDLTHD